MVSYKICVKFLSQNVKKKQKLIYQLAILLINLKTSKYAKIEFKGKKKVNYISFKFIDEYSYLSKNIVLTSFIKKQ